MPKAKPFSNESEGGIARELNSAKAEIKALREILLCVLIILGGCASTEYSKVPEPTGDWMPANPPMPVRLAR